MKKNKLTIIQRTTLVLIAIALVILIVVIGYSSPRIIHPMDGLVTTNASVLFSFEKANYLIIDDNTEFSSPEKIYAKDNLVVNLKPGVYYWKAVGERESEVRKLAVNSRVDLRVEEKDDTLRVINSGNVALNVSVYNRSNLIGSVIADVGEPVDMNGDEYLGRQHG